VIAASAAGSHAIARTEDRPMLLAATALHQAGAALWLGGLPALLAALRLRPETAAAVGRRYSGFAAVGVALILLGIGGFWLGYIGEVEAVYGTAYGAMAGTKAALLGLMLLLGLGNFLQLHRLGAGAAALSRVRRFVEAEAAIGLAALALAASLTSVPPAADLPEDRVSWSDIAERFTPAAPRFSSPSRADLAIPALQAKLDAEWRAREQAQSSRPEAFTPGEGLLPPRNAGDIAWSEYNHHWSGLLVLLVGFAALLDGTGKVPIPGTGRCCSSCSPCSSVCVPTRKPGRSATSACSTACATRRWCSTSWPPCSSRASPWRSGRCASAGSAGGCASCSPARCSPVASCCCPTPTPSATCASAAGGAVAPAAAVLAVVGGSARWTELRGPPELARPAAAVWPACLVLIGVLLLIYREA
jgi:putative copper resistance protein D